MKGFQKISRPHRWGFCVLLDLSPYWISWEMGLPLLLNLNLAVLTKSPPISGHFLQYWNVGCIIFRPKIVILGTDFILKLFLNLFSISRHLWVHPPQTTTIPVFSFCTQHLRHFSLLKANVFQEKRGSPRYLVLDIQKQF